MFKGRRVNVVQTQQAERGARRGRVTSKTPSSPVNEPGGGVFRGPRSERPGIKACAETEVRGHRGLLGRAGVRMSALAQDQGEKGCEGNHQVGGGGAAASGKTQSGGLKKPSIIIQVLT